MLSHRLFLHRRTVALASAITVHLALLLYLSHQTTVSSYGMGSLNGYSTEGISQGQVSLIALPQLMPPDISESVATSDTIPVPIEAIEDDLKPLHEAAKQAANTDAQSEDFGGIGSGFSPHELWRIIKPCWESLADTSIEAVSIDVSFSPLGHAIPKSSVPNAENNLPLSHSESIARMAIARCGPYPTVYGQSAVRIEFPQFKAMPVVALPSQ
ncbi:hypothetical protein [Asticcacaulis endophyticus]|nr:hypothetical protein [Asticcacaulis endophyticus]